MWGLFYGNFVLLSVIYVTEMLRDFITSLGTQRPKDRQLQNLQQI